MWTLWFDLYEANELAVPAGVSSFFNLIEAEVEVSVGPHKVFSNRDTIKNGTAKWYACLEEKKIRFQSDPEQVPDIFVNVYAINSVLRTRARVGYTRLKVRSQLFIVLGYNIISPKCGHRLLIFLCYMQHEFF
jgi:hypothetical protein